ncbi:MAG: hypothetical protein JXA24_07690 [Proteobacteria bacterium]|nr:hypothetical protein [Pseudomonadota bacterium]
MYRIAAVVFLLATLAACSHDNGFGMQFDANPNVSGDVSMESLTVRWFGDEGVEHAETEVTIDAARGITVKATLIDAQGSAVDSCSGSVEISEEDYQSVIAKVGEANLLTYTLPVEGSPECVVDASPSDFGLVYEYRQGEDVLSKAFETDGCEIAPAIEELAALVGQLAETNVTDCSAAALSVEDEAAEAEEAEAEDEQDNEDDPTDNQ